MGTDPLPAAGTVERWAFDLIGATTLAAKLEPSAPPERWEEDPPVRRVDAPGRPPELRVAPRSAKTPRPGALEDPRARALLVHAFLHHEVQAAELMAWALLAFPDTPRAFRAGLLAIVREELAHARLYREHLEALGADVADFPVRDWFWERVPTCERPEQFCALMGMGLEGANLDHASRFADRFRAAGDERGAAIQVRVVREEVAHVRFAVRWFERWTRGVDFDRWRRELPAPLTPILFRGKPLARELRERAGLPPGFLRELEAFEAPLVR